MEQKRMIQLLKILSCEKDPISGPQLSERLNITVRTLRNDLKNYKRELQEHGMEITSKHAVGYQ